MKKYIWLPDGRLAIKNGSLLDWLIRTFIPHSIGYYEVIRIGVETNWAAFSFKQPNKHRR